MTRPTPTVVRTVADLRAAVSAFRAKGDTIAMVPTMGALHAGHISLVEAAKAAGARVVVSIFVNPTQFAPTEDFSKYPRTFEADLAKLAAVDAELVYAPTVDVMYPRGFVTSVNLAGPATAGLEDVARPHHFGGVATIVTKLFTQCRPDLAIFGEKDFQQLAVIRRMAVDLDLAVDVRGAPTIREADGLAMSSRNVYLTAADRAKAPHLHAAMQTAAAAIRRGGLAAIETALAAGRATIAANGFALDYLECRAADDLGAARPDTALRLLVAARIGQVRLIDNIAV
ncbi:pantoate--beta-alanine ligase [Phreatobacter sp. AB_2022a]|uniref:pantoate--beta-alanine ligase n=1 Tax=Phreatobacter sp. AB_2022a TaxID=3003134 RepID=UPI00228720C7|nr:pantoate--beta-alanine ligase [Phreatobacter sp. AB_2022a]MCZ0735398.1 pantoate--beta-alanine ligase [Phreatobacter sp. AB_2022a]